MDDIKRGEGATPQAATLDEEREQMHRQMLSSVSHDLKTPLASVIGSLEIFDRMKDKLNEERQHTLIQVALQEAYRLDTFISNILDMAKLENGMVRAQSEATELEPLIKNCVLRLSNRLQNSFLHIEGKSGVIAPNTDPVLLNRALSLVIDNAVKYGGNPSKVDILFGRDEQNNAYISVHDNGTGVDEDRYDSIFSKYTRFATQDKQTAGTGLGLAISRAIMTLLKGTVTVRTPREGGALFTLTLPL